MNATDQGPVVDPSAPGMLPCAREGCKQGSYNNNGIVTNIVVVTNNNNNNIIIITVIVVNRDLDGSSYLVLIITMLNKY